MVPPSAADTPRGERERELRALAEQRDREDEFAALRTAYALPGDDDFLYLVGNSLGPPRVGASERAEAFVREQWGAHLVAGWNACGWMDAAFRVGDKIGRLIGAAPGQVVAGDTTTVQLYRALAAALALRPERKVLVLEADNFPADNYIAQGLVHDMAAHAGRSIELRAVPGADLSRAIEDAGTQLAAVSASHVNYRDGRVLDIASLGARAHHQGGLALWDLAHSAGLIDARLDAIDCDFAVGCGYKYLNGGPGAPAFLYVNRRHHGLARSPTWGWLGHAKPFDLAPEHEPAAGIAGFLCGTPNVAALDALEFALAPLLEAAASPRGLGGLRDKSGELGDFFVGSLERLGLMDVEAPRAGELELASPRAHGARGGHVALRHPRAHELARALEANKVRVDFRAPDTLRLAFAPAYTRFVDALRAAESIARILGCGAHLKAAYRERRAVT